MSTTSVGRTAKPPFVLVHGGRHGGWCWQRVAQRLRSEGHLVLTPTLTGLGERSHLLSREIGLETHIQDVVNVFEFEDLHDAILVAHSYGGMPVTGAMETIADRVSTLVYLDALVPRTGQSLLDVLDDAGRAFMRRAAAEGDDWLIPVSDASAWGVTDPDDAAWVNSKITPQPFKTLCDPVPSAERAWSHPSVFVEFHPSTPFPLDNPRERALASAPCDYRRIEAAHDAMITDPDAVTAQLLDVARSSMTEPAPREAGTSMGNH